MTATTSSRKHKFKRPPWAIVALLLAILLVELVLMFEGRLRWMAFAAFSFNPAVLAVPEPFYPAQPWAMFISHVFVHIGPLHMLGNLLTLYLLWYLMPWMYTSDFLLVFAGGALGGTMAFLWLAPPTAVMTGASGAVAALAAVWGIYEMFLVQRGHILSIRPKRTAVTIGLVSLAVLLSLDRQLGMAWQVHLGGAIAGAGFGVGLIARAIWEARYGPFDR